jgi:hypothetical protein
MPASLLLARRPERPAPVAAAQPSAAPRGRLAAALNGASVVQRLQRTAQLLRGRPVGAIQMVPVLQCIVVTEDDIGDDFEITTTSGHRTVGELTEIRGGGWYLFDVMGSDELVRGQANIHRRVNGSSSSSSSTESTDSSEDEDMPDSGIGYGGYSSVHEPTTKTEFDIEKVARKNGISVLEAMMRIRNSFQVDPRTLRLHFPFGAKTVSRGAPAFNTPDETDKDSQAMVSYRMGDYGKHKKVGKDYDDWADELSDEDESEKTKRSRAKSIVKFLEEDESMDFEDLEDPQKVSLGGMLSVALISDPLRTEHNSRRTESDFMDQLRQRSRGEISFHDMIGSKTDSTFLPARSGGSGQQREALRKQTDKAKKELRGQGRLWQNNCLINAICQAAHGRNATMEELLAIRFNLNNVGQMMVATQATVNVIRSVLQINNEIVVRYPVGSPALNETFAGVPATLNIYHTGADHFQHNPPMGTLYK